MLHSIQSKFTALILAGILLAAFAVGGIGVYASARRTAADADAIMNLAAEDHARELDETLDRVRFSAEMIAAQTLQAMEEFSLPPEDPAYAAACLEEAEKICASAAGSMQGISAFYFLETPAEGFLYVKTAETRFERAAFTELPLYAPESAAQAGWYMILGADGEISQLSYVLPLDGAEGAVLGVDVNFHNITAAIREIRYLESGYAFLADAEGKVLYHPALSAGASLETAYDNFPAFLEALSGEKSESLFSCRYQGAKQKLAFCTLNNGMKLVLAAYTREINAGQRHLLWMLILCAVVVTLIFAGFSILMTRKITAPLRELTAVAREISEGNLDVRVHATDADDEIGELSRSFQQTTEYVREYIWYVNGLAYQDSLTGVKNKTAYADAVENLRQEQAEGTADYGLLLVDINNLKTVNDTYGHEYGDQYIIKMTQMICQTFMHSPVYRIGGDEFVVLLKNSDLQNFDELFAAFKGMMDYDPAEDLPIWETVTAAAGVAYFDPNQDGGPEDVFQRADNAMYEDKQRMKQELGLPER